MNRIKNSITKLLLLIIINFIGICQISCRETRVDLDMNTYYKLPDNIDNINSSVKIVLLIGQSNASGCSIVEYLKLNTKEEVFDRYKNGYKNVLINYCIDNHSFTSNGNFVNVNLNCGCGEGFFGPEVGFADKVSNNYDEQIIILKYTMSGYSLDFNWIKNDNPGAIYLGCKIFVTTYIECLKENGIDVDFSWILWMQGESDHKNETANKYYNNQLKLIELLRNDFIKYSKTNKLYFIDAGISNSPYCEPGYPIINKSKEEISKLSNENIYFSTIDLGLTTTFEPDYNPDLGHYDSTSCIKLGEKFGEEFLKTIYSQK